MAQEGATLAGSRRAPGGRIAGVAALALSLLCAGVVWGESPICRVAAISLPISSAPSGEGAAEGGVSEGSLPDARASSRLAAFVACANAHRVDAVLLLCPPSWAGSEGDLADLRAPLEGAHAPVHLLSSERALAGEGSARIGRALPGCRVTARGVLDVKGAQFVVAGAVERGIRGERAFLSFLREARAGMKSPRAVLQIGGPIYGRPAPVGARWGAEYWRWVEGAGVAARLTPAHDLMPEYAGTLPGYPVPFLGWGRSCAAVLISVYPDRVEFAQAAHEAGQPPRTLSIPNPLGAPRWLPVEADPSGSPTWSRDAALGPELSFAHLSDSQFDDQGLPRTGARYLSADRLNPAAVEEVNRLKPAFVLMTGDLVNKNTHTEWRTFQSIYGRLAMPLYALPGNHDRLGGEGDGDPGGDFRAIAAANRAHAARLAREGFAGPLALFQKYTAGLASGGRTRYSFERNGSVFICLDTSSGAIEPEQVKWLEEELERAHEARHVFVAGHHPLLPVFEEGVVEGRDETLALLKKHKVAAYLFGHCHDRSYRLEEGTLHVMGDCLCWDERRGYWVVHVFADRILFGWKPLGPRAGMYPLYESVEVPEPRAAGR